MRPHRHGARRGGRADAAVRAGRSLGRGPTRDARRVPPGDGRRPADDDLGRALSRVVGSGSRRSGRSATCARRPTARRATSSSTPRSTSSWRCDSRRRRPIRPVELREFCIGGPMNTPHIVAQVPLTPGERREVRCQVGPGLYRVRAGGVASGAALDVQVGEADGASGAVAVSVRPEGIRAGPPGRRSGRPDADGRATTSARARRSSWRTRAGRTRSRRPPWSARCRSSATCSRRRCWRRGSSLA